MMTTLINHAELKHKLSEGRGLVSELLLSIIVHGKISKELNSPDPQTCDKT